MLLQEDRCIVGQVLSTTGCLCARIKKEERRIEEGHKAEAVVDVSFLFFSES